jgi:pimeloyl-ACP methyl ester carboxylesterase
MHQRISRRKAVGGVAAAGAGIIFLDANAQSASSGSGPKQKKPARPNRGAWLTLPPTPELPATNRKGLVAVNGTRLFFAQFGEGPPPPVLFLHGGLANSNYWGHQIQELTRAHTVVVMDTRGHGQSPLTSDKFSYSTFAEDAEALLNLLKIDRAAIVGWSDGAITGLQLAISKPERISRLFAYGANSSPGGLKPGGSRNQTFASYMARCRAEYSQLSPHPERWPRLVSGLGAMWRTEPHFTKAMLATIKLPTVISVGEHDEIIRREDTEYLANLIPGARLMLQLGVSHFAMLQNPIQFNSAVVELLRL